MLLRVQTEDSLKRGRSAAYAAQQAIVLDRPSDLVLQISISHSTPQLSPRAILKDVIVHFFIETRLTHLETLNTWSEFLLVISYRYIVFHIYLS